MKKKNEDDIRFVVVDIDASGIINCAQYATKNEAEKDELHRNTNAPIMTRRQFEKFKLEYKKLFR